MKRITIIGMLLMFSSTTAFANSYASYKGKIKSLYSSEQDNGPYFGIELASDMVSNPCGASLRYFIKAPNKVSQMHLSMLISAHMAGKVVEISNRNATPAEACHGQYPTFNFVKVLE